MELIREKVFNRVFTEKEFSWDFQINQEGIYGIEITASAKSWKQNLFHFHSFLKDDDLSIRIDNKSFDSRAVWNGDKLKGAKKINFFLINFSPGGHKFDFLADQSPELKTVRIFQIKDKNISYLPQDNYLSSKNNRIPWMSIILVNLSLKDLKIRAKAQEGKKFTLFKRDDSDLKLIINNQIQKNQEPKSHKYWYWCGRTLKGESKIFDKELNLESGIHYLELWVDRNPKIEEIKIGVRENERQPGEIKRIPTVDDPRWTGEFRDDTERILLARVIFGEARNQIEEARIAVAWSAKNRIEDTRWGNTYHQVILQSQQYSAFNKGDPNFPYVQDPFLDKTQKNAWYECYEIAGRMIKGELKDLTNGANHYYSDDINSPWWTKSEEAEFKIKIDNLIFYNLRRNKNSGRVKLFLVILISLGFVLLGRIIFVSIEDRVFGLVIEDQSISSKYFFIHPVWNEVAVMYFDQDGKFIDLEQLTNDGYDKSHLSVFSEGGKLGYFQKLHKKGEYLDYEDEQVRKEYYDNYTALMIVNEGASPFEVYRGDNHISDWGWFSYYQVTVYESCGTGCQSWKHINIGTKEIEEQGATFFESN